MHHPRTTVRAGLTLLFLITAVATGYRIYRSISHGWWDFTTSSTTGLLLVASFYAGWRIHNRLRVQANDWRERIQKRQDELLDGDEDRALWDSVEPATVEDDTCAFGINVVAINQFRNFPRAG